MQFQHKFFDFYNILEYSEMVDSLEKAFHKSVTRFILPDESDEEISIEYAATQERKKPRLIQSKQHSDMALKRARSPPLQKVKFTFDSQFYLTKITCKTLILTSG